MIAQTDLFVARDHGYDTYRIPSLAVTKGGTLLAFCEARRHSRADFGQIDLVLKRSFDGGNTWTKMQEVAAQDGVTSSNPCPVADRDTGTIWLPFCKNPAQADEPTIIRGEAQRTVWLTKSEDEGSSWSEPIEITSQVKRSAWTWYATGPGHGVQLSSGRLIIPCNHAVGTAFERSDPRHSHVIYSDDHGASWHIGGVVGEGTNECEVVELVDGALYINCRNFAGPGKRGVARSFDGGESFQAVMWDSALSESTSDADDVLPEPVACQASVIRLSTEAEQGKNRILFCNPAGSSREQLTVRLSYDEAKTWPLAKVLCGGPSAYSDLAVLPNGTICCLYERGEAHPYETLTLARFDLAWLTDGTGRQP